MANAEIRNLAKEKRVRLWQIAERFGMTDNSFSRKLRHEFSAEEKSKALLFIEQISKEQEASR